MPKLSTIKYQEVNFENFSDQQKKKKSSNGWIEKADSVHRKEKYLDKGLVQLEYREVYFDGPGLWAGLLARCKGNEKYFPMIDLIFKNQEDWARGNIDNIKAGLLSMGRQAGLTDEESLACMQDDNLAEELVVLFQENAKRDNISSTPSFLINGQLVKNLPFPDCRGRYYFI